LPKVVNTSAHFTQKSAVRRKVQNTAVSMNSSPFSKMLTDHMLNNLQQESKKFPFNAGSLAKSFAAEYSNGCGVDFSETKATTAAPSIKSERLSPPNLKTELELEPQTSFSRSPSISPRTASETPPRHNESAGYSAQTNEDQKRHNTVSDQRDSNFLPPPPNQFNARNYSDIMRSLAAKYNTCNTESLPNPPAPSFNEARPSQAGQSKIHSSDNYSTSSQVSPNSSVNPLNLLTGLRFSPAMFPPFMDMSSTQTLLTLAKVAKEAEMQKLKSGIKSFDHVALTRQIGQLLSVSSSNSGPTSRHRNNGDTGTSPLDLSSTPVTKRIKLSPSSPTSKNNSHSDSSSPSLSSSGNRVVCEKEAATNEVDAWTVDQVCDFVGSIDICAEYVQNFRDQRIDGTGLPLLTEDHLTGSLGMKLGPALKLRSLLAKRLSPACTCSSCPAPSCSSESLPRPASSDPVVANINLKLE